MDNTPVGWLVTPMIPVGNEQAAVCLAERYGVSGTLEELDSAQDRNFRVRMGPGHDGYVLKMFNPVSDGALLQAQCEAVERLADALPDLRLPRACRGADGEFVQRISVNGQALDCQLLDYVPGEPIMDSRYLAPRVVERLGELAGRITVGLEGFVAPVVDQPLLWDLRNAHTVVEVMAPHMADRKRADRVLRAAHAAHELLERHVAGLPVQVIHGDVTDNNVVFERGPDGRPMPVGVIDFGDLMHGWAVAELAVTCTSVLHHHGATPASVLPAVRAFHTVRPLGDTEVQALWPLIVLRACVLVVCGQYDALMDPGNNYATAALDREWAMFEASVAVPAEVMTAQFQYELEVIGDRLEPTTGMLTGAHRLIPELLGEVRTLDLSVMSDALHSGRWLDADAESALAGQDLVENGAVLTRHGEYRLTRTAVDTTHVVATLALGVEAYLTGPTQIRAPWPGTVTRHAERGLTLAADGLGLVLDGIHAGSTGVVEAGQPLGTVAAVDGSHRIHVQLSRLADGQPPRFVTPELAAGWLDVCPDPTELITQASARPGAMTSALALLERREQSFAAAQEHYFTAPPQIERGWRHYLVDTEGRGYLDMLNNVTVLGHGHPRLASAVHRQWQILNTNSRFHYESVVRLSERLTAMLPDELNTVFLVNSGSEAVDLALRLAWAATGRRDVVAMDEAYHGCTYASDAVSTSTADNPDAPGSRPEWVHTVPAPNAYRGSHRGAEAHRYGPEAVTAITELARSGRPPAAFICEPYYGNAGGMALPDGYLAQVYAATRAAGGLCIADEVQVGLGRLGSFFWGFEQQEVVPDIVTIAKAMGNGHPLGAVVTRHDIAEAYRAQGYFFSSAGGSPVSSMVGLTVLDVLRDERLQENANIVGAHLRTRLRELADKHPLIGAVHGTGLYLGVELVRDRRTMEPATEETAAICERLRELGVIAQPTSDRMCILKIKPPLCLTTTSADVFIAALDDALSHGW